MTNPFCPSYRKVASLLYRSRARIVYVSVVCIPNVGKKININNNNNDKSRKKYVPHPRMYIYIYIEAHLSAEITYV